MIRRVAFKKAALAGALGACAWEAAGRALGVAGVPVLDLVRVLGTMAVGDVPWWQWWPVGMAHHLLVGVIWAVFYAYFFWSFFDLRPALQGMIFSLLPAVLAGLIMIPQMDLMRAGTHGGQLPSYGVFAFRLGFWGPASIVLGHLIYGAVMGSLYTRPVGYPVGRRAVRYG
jgi:hypothetical protein